MPLRVLQGVLGSQTSAASVRTHRLLPPTFAFLESNVSDASSYNLSKSSFFPFSLFDFLICKLIVHLDLSVDLFF